MSDKALAPAKAHLTEWMSVGESFEMLNQPYSRLRLETETAGSGVFKLPAGGVTLCYDVRKPFDALAKGLSVQSSRGDKI